MDPVIGSIVVATAGLGTQGIACVATYLRLRWRVRQQQAHRQYLAELAVALPPGSRLEEAHPDGSTLRLTIPQQQVRQGVRRR